MQLIPSLWCNNFSLRLLRFFKREKCICFHCGEVMRKEGALMATFQNEMHPVCCHGCLAVLNTIQKNGLVDAYLQAKQANLPTELSESIPL